MNKKFFDRFTFYILFFIFVIDFVLITFTHNSWSDSIRMLTIFQNKVTHLRNELAEAHLWFEEAMGGDKSIDLEKDVMVHFKNQKFIDFLNKQTLNKDNQEVLESLSNIEIKLKKIHLFAKQRWTNITHTSIGSDSDQEFDYMFVNLLQDIDRTIDILNTSISNEIEKKDSNYIFIVSLFTIFNILILIIVLVVTNYKKRLADRAKQKEEVMFRNTKLASMGEMLGNIAHQWRQPLSVISVAITGIKIKRELGNLSDEFFNESVESINKNVQYLSQTIDDFRNFIKNDKETIPFSLNENIDSFTKLIDSSCKSNNIQIILDIKDEITIESYPNELLQCFINIYNNSKDAFEENDIDEEKRLIFITMYDKKDEAIIEFKDTANGIPKQVIGKIFEPYFTTKHQAEGTGLGLHMTYNIITNSMKGTILVQNTKFTYDDQNYTGAKFIISLPKEILI